MTLPAEPSSNDKGRGVFHGTSNWQKQIQEELAEFDESHMLVMNKLMEVVRARKEEEDKQNELNATAAS